MPSDVAITERIIRSLEERVEEDPRDFIAHNKLAGYYLQGVRETGSMNHLELASRAARASFAEFPREQNTGALSALAQIEYASHNFVAARDRAKRLIELDPRKLQPYQLLGDSLLELGDYEGAAAVFRQMERRNDHSHDGIVTTEIRLARLALLRGETDTVEKRLSIALTTALDAYPPSRETIAWCRWQLGETAFSIGDYETAERHYRHALTTFPDYDHALASLGRLRAARGDFPGAIAQYEHAVGHFPDPVFVAALGDLYKLTGRDKEAAAQYALVEQTAGLSTLNGTLYNRQLALFYADHDMNVEEAYARALKEYTARRDIYGADAVAWTALKAGGIAEAQAAMTEALRLGTRDARLFYHAGMIARAAGDNWGARDYLKRALALNPRFDPLQSSLANKALEE